MRPQKPPFLLHDPGEPNIPGRGFLIAVTVLVVAMLGFVGRMDYLEAAADECRAKGMMYDPENDVCFKQSPSTKQKDHNHAAPPESH